MTELRVRQAVLDDILAHAREAAPNECCGLLIGAGVSVEAAARARNLRASPTRFLVDPADQFAALRRARARGLTLVGAYHSHPASPPEPSPTDLAEAVDPTYVHLIVSPSFVPAIGAFRFTDGSAVTLRLVPIP